MGFIILAAGHVVVAEQTRAIIEDAEGVSGTQPATATRPAATRPAATRPAVATRPAPDDPIIRLGDAAVITQREFELEMRGRAMNDPYTALSQISRSLVNRKLIELYVKEHPDFITTEEIDEAVNDYMKKYGIDTREEFERRLNEMGYTVEYFRWRKMEDLANSKFNIEGTKLSEDEKLLERMWEENRTDWDGTRVVARHILLALPAFATPEQKREAYDKLKAIRKDLVSGKRTWEECLPESSCRTRGSGGKMGSFRRHLELNYGDKLAGVAFDLEPNQYSEVVETDWGYHILQVTSRRPGNQNFEKAKRLMRIWLRIQPKARAMRELREKYPVIGVQLPAPPLPEAEPSERVDSETSADGQSLGLVPSGTRLAGSLATRPAPARNP